MTALDNPLETAFATVFQPAFQPAAPPPFNAMVDTGPIPLVAPTAVESQRLFAAAPEPWITANLDAHLARFGPLPLADYPKGAGKRLLTGETVVHRTRDTRRRRGVTTTRWRAECPKSIPSIGEPARILPLGARHVLFGQDVDGAA